MNKDKQLGRSKAAHGFKYYGFTDGLFCYSKQVMAGLYKGRWIECRAEREDLDNGNIEFMLENGWTR